MVPQIDVATFDIDAANALLEAQSPAERVRWAIDRLRPRIVLSSSFGAQAAVLLHLVTREWPEIPVVVIDTGYLFPETYRFADELTARLRLNVKVYRAVLSPAWQEAQQQAIALLGERDIAAFDRATTTVRSSRARGLI